MDDIDCPVRTLKNFMDRTANIRENLYKEHTLFLTDVEKEDQIYKASDHRIMDTTSDARHGH